MPDDFCFGNMKQLVANKQLWLDQSTIDCDFSYSVVYLLGLWAQLLFLCNFCNQIFILVVFFIRYDDTIASSSTCQSVGEWVNQSLIVSDLEMAIASELCELVFASTCLPFKGPSSFVRNREDRYSAIFTLIELDLMEGSVWKVASFRWLIYSMAEKGTKWWELYII